MSEGRTAFKLAVALAVATFYAVMMTFSPGTTGSASVPVVSMKLVREAKAIWASQRSRVYLDYISNARRRAVVGRVCGGILDEEERWMCEKRGAHLAERMNRYTAASRNHLADMLETFEHRLPHSAELRKKECGMWFSIVDGKLDTWGTFGDALPYADVWHLSIGRVLEAIKNGAIEPGQTFDYVLLFGDGAARVPASPFTSIFPQYPIAKYSYTPTNEPHHFAMPWFEGWQLDSHLPHRPYLPFEKLKTQAITRNALETTMRVYLSMLSGSGFNPLLNVSMLPGKIDQRPLCRELLPRMIKALKAEHARDPTSFDLDAVLEQLSSVRDKDAPCGQLVYGNRIDWDEYVSYKYLISPDSREAPVSRFWMLMRAPGVTMPILESKKTFQEYYFRDAVPFLHYVPVTDDLDALATNITTSLQWLEQHQATAKYIGEESTRWVGRHKTHKTDMRQYKLYFALLSDMYVADPTRELPGRVDRKVECTETAETFLFYGVKGCNGALCDRWASLAWNLSCGPRSDAGSILTELLPAAPKPEGGRRIATVPHSSGRSSFLSGLAAFAACAAALFGMWYASHWVCTSDE